MPSPSEQLHRSSGDRPLTSAYAPPAQEGAQAAWLAEGIATDGPRSYEAAMNELGNAEKQEVGRRANNRMKNSHLSFRRREVVSDVDQPSLERHVGLERSRYPDLC